MLKVLHFADAHIDMANYGRHDTVSGLPFRVLDFLKSLDTIVDAAIAEQVDLVLFAGDAYKDRTPAPTYQREWGKRIMRLSHAGIPTLLLVGNHDVSPATGRAFSFEEFNTLEVPHIQVVSKPCLLKPDDLEGVPVQVLALPWVTRSTVSAGMMNSNIPENIDPLRHLEEAFTALVDAFLNQTDPNVPVILLAHASIEGAIYGGERAVMLGADFALPGSLVKDKRIDYTALGHIHKKQNLNEGGQPPVVYPGSIERVDFGEAGDDKFFVIADVEKKNTQIVFKQLNEIRSFIDRFVKIEENDSVSEKLIGALQPKEQLTNAIVRLTIDYPRNMELLIDEQAVRDFAADAFETHIIHRPRMDARSRLNTDQNITTLDPVALTDTYWRSINLSEAESLELQKLAQQVISETWDAEASEVTQ